MHDAITDAQKRESDSLAPQARLEPNSGERASMAEQARRLLAGQERWEPPRPARPAADALAL